MLIDKEKEKAMLIEFFVALCEAEAQMADGINRLIHETDSREASVRDATARIANDFSNFMHGFDDTLRDELNIDTMGLFKDEEANRSSRK